MIQPTIPTEPTYRSARAPGQALDARVLVAEDSPDSQRLISLHLRRAGCEVVVASNGLDAIQMYQTHRQNQRPFDCVLMDLNMPELDGYEATRRLRSLGATEPILAFTAQALASDRQRCMDAGCDDYATKPMEAESLLDYCRKWIGAHGSRHAA
jgi:CheY-like chemotaxis protein